MGTLTERLFYRGHLGQAVLVCGASTCIFDRMSVLWRLPRTGGLTTEVLAVSVDR